jgi:transposase
MSKNGTLPRRYTDEFRVEAVRLGESIGGNQAAKRLGIPESSLWNWMRRSRLGKLVADAPGVIPVKRSSGELEAEIDRLRRELANAKQDLDIVKKAAAYFAKESR